LFFCFSFVLSAWRGAGSTIDDVLNIPYVEYAPVIDGEIDEDWVLGFPNVHMFGYIFEQADSFHGYSDFASFYKAAWNEDGFYFYGWVVDDSLTGTADAENPHNNDCWEIYFDGDNSKTAPYDENDIQWRWVYGMPVDSVGKSGWADVGNWAWAETSDGYSFELEIPVSELVKNGDAGIPFFTKTRDQLFPLEEGQVIGFEVQVADNDGAGREAMTKWWAESNNSWQDPGLFGTVYLGDDDVMLGIKHLEFSPTIDGELGDDWVDVEDNEIPEVKMSGYINEAGMFDGDSDISSSYRVAWNADGIYFFGSVIDDSVTGEADPENPHNNDCFEIYFDGDNSKTSPYDSNDIHWRWVYGKTEIEPGWADVGNWIWLKTADGYNFELEIPASELVKNEAQLFYLEVGTVIGFEVQVADNDGDVREAMTKWWAADNNSWQDPGLFGTAMLFLYIPGISEPFANIELSVPPVLNSIASISYTIDAPSSVKLVLYNLSGQAVKTLDGGAKAPGTYTTSVDVSGLANGVYLCRLEAGNSATTKKITLIK
jgi:hypothetical protein